MKALSGRNRLLLAVVVAVLGAGVAGGIALARGDTGRPAGKVGVLARGKFRTVTWGTTGRAIVERTASGKLVLRFDEAFGTRDAPDLYVYLDQQDPRAHHGNRGKSLLVGSLANHQGGQHYDAPRESELDDRLPGRDLLRASATRRTRSPSSARRRRADSLEPGTGPRPARGAERRPPLGRDRGARRGGHRRPAGHLHPRGRSDPLPAGSVRPASVARQGTLARPRDPDAAAAGRLRTRSGSSGRARSASSAAGTSICRSRSAAPSTATTRRISSSTSGSPARAARS